MIQRLVKCLPYEEDHLEMKHMVWVIYSGLLGAFVGIIHLIIKLMELIGMKVEIIYLFVGMIYRHK